MSKIQQITIHNFKAISDLDIDFKGCTCIITGANNTGKSSFLKGIPQRIRGERPELILKDGEETGSGVMTLTTGERFEWEFDKGGKDKLTFVSKEGFKQKVTKQIAEKFFPPIFDIDRFLESAPKLQMKMLQKLVGIDFTQIDAEYQTAYDDRTEMNRQAELYHAKLTKANECPKVDAVDLTELQTKKQAERDRLNQLYLDNKAASKKLLDAFNEQTAALRKKIKEDNAVEKAKQEAIDNAEEIKIDLVKWVTERGVETMVDWTKLVQYIVSLPKAGTIWDEEIEVAKLTPPVLAEEKPDDTELQKIDAAILSASETNAKAQKYKEWCILKADVAQGYEDAQRADKAVKEVELRRGIMIKNAKFPKGIEMDDNGIYVDGYPLDKNQISTSKLYCAALRLAMLNIGEVRSLYFDASTLDKNSFKEINDWAVENDLQILVERVAYDGGEIKYELIEEAGE